MRVTTPLLIGAAMLFAAPAVAQPDPTDPVPEPEPEPVVEPEPVPDPVPAVPRHEQLASEGREELAAGNVARACELFQKSDELSPNEDVQFEHAQCLERLGKKRQGGCRLRKDRGSRRRKSQRSRATRRVAA